MLSRWLVCLIVASAFGPYVLPGVRTDQVVVYGVAAALLPFAWDRIRLSGLGVCLAGAWVIYLGVATLGYLAPGANTSPWPRGSVFANLDNLLLPLVTLLLVGALVSREPREKVLMIVTSTIAVGACFNALVAIAHYLSPTVVIPYLDLFWGAGETGERAVTLGRYSGITGQPSVSGVLYSLGLVCALYAFRGRPVLRVVALVLIVIGGVLTVSKGFLLVGVPVAAWQIIRSSRGKAGERLGVLLAVGGVYIGASELGLFDRWSGWERLVHLLPGGGADFAQYTGNRYGTGSSMEPLVRSVMTDHPLGGYGLSGLATATDTAVVQALTLAGLLGATCVVVVLAIPLLSYFRQRLCWGPQKGSCSPQLRSWQ